MATLLEDIKIADSWIIEAMESSGYSLNSTITSFKEIDRFFDDNTKKGKPKRKSVLAKFTGKIVFALGSYIGETIIKQYGGIWQTDDKDPQGEINISVKMMDDSIIWPVQRVLKRLQNGTEDSIFVYGIGLKPQ